MIEDSNTVPYSRACDTLITHIQGHVTLESHTQVTKIHFDDLKRRYGPSVVVLNLVKAREKRPRETILRKELAIALNIINAQVCYLVNWFVCWLGMYICILYNYARYTTALCLFHYQALIKPHGLSFTTLSTTSHSPPCQPPPTLSNSSAARGPASPVHPLSTPFPHPVRCLRPSESCTYPGTSRNTQSMWAAM